MIPAPTLWGLAGLAGLAVGSYATTAAMRWARGEDHVRGWSHCDACGDRLGLSRTVPLLSYVAQRGACAACRAPIPWLHPVGELVGAVIALGAVALALSGPAWRAAPLVALGLALLADAVIDLRLRRLPDALTAVVAIAGIVLAAGRGTSALAAGVLAAAISTGLLLIVRSLSARRTGDPGLGLGDVKLVAALALWLGAATALMVGLAAVLGLATAAATRGGDPRRPFGPALAVSGWGLGLALELGWTPWGL